MEQRQRRIIRVGEVVELYKGGGLKHVKIKMKDADKVKTKPLALVCSEEEISKIAVNDLVFCVFLPFGLEDGFCLGKIPKVSEAMAKMLEKM